MNPFKCNNRTYRWSSQVRQFRPRERFPPELRPTFPIAIRVSSSWTRVFCPKKCIRRDSSNANQKSLSYKANKILIHKPNKSCDYTIHHPFWLSTRCTLDRLWPPDWSWNGDWPLKLRLNIPFEFWPYHKSDLDAIDSCNDNKSCVRIRVFGMWFWGNWRIRRLLLQKCSLVPDTIWYPDQLLKLF